MRPRTLLQNITKIPKSKESQVEDQTNCNLQNGLIIQVYHTNSIFLKNVGIFDDHINILIDIILCVYGYTYLCHR